MKTKTTSPLELVKLCCRALDDKKAGDLTILDVSAQSSITDYLVLATATSEPHLRALRVELEKALDADNIHLVGMETSQESGWTVIDAFDVMIHLFLPTTREHYGLERLWRDATKVSLAKLLAQPAKKVPKKSIFARAPAKSRRKKAGD
ncbi:MAG: ribosome silencing factor [Opitutus sp.]|nr:ribosome silencing factor [Opitutus sp.]